MARRIAASKRSIGWQQYIVADEEPGERYWGTFVYKLTVDERVANQKLVTGLDWWKEAFKVVSIQALKFFGLRLLLEFNERPLVYYEKIGDWVPAPQPRKYPYA